MWWEESASITVLVVKSMALSTSAQKSASLSLKWRYIAPVVRPALAAISRREAFIKPFSRNSAVALFRIFFFVSADASPIDTVYSQKDKKVKKKMITKLSKSA